MNRASFLRRAAGAGVALVVGRKLGPAVAAPPVEVEPEAAVLVETFENGWGDALVASGGLCAPLYPYYELVSVGARPVRDALPVFSADGGGLRFRSSSGWTIVQDPTE